ncbi:MAG: DUF484 family protein [Paracoccaceae bacterium]
MTNPLSDARLRERLLASPEVLLEDRDLMQALAAAGDRARGANVVDLRGMAMDRLETRLSRLEGTHRDVISAAYENMAGTEQIHRAVLRLLEASDMAEFLSALHGDVARILRVDTIRLCIEGRQGQDATRAAAAVTVLQPGGVDAYMTGGRPVAPARVTLRRTSVPDDTVHGRQFDQIASEGCVRLNLGSGRAAAMLVMGSTEEDTFAPGQGTDLLAFLGGAIERCLRRWVGAAG